MSFALVVGTSMPAFAATPLATISDVDKDGLSNKIEVKITRTDPLEADTDNDRIDDGDEDVDEDGVDNTDELWLGTKVTDDDSDHDSVEDGDEDKDRDGIDNEDEDELGNDEDDPDSDHDHAGEYPTQEP
ncbi:MAG: hypothetical protein M3N18_04205 [Actinomycetota bacterium]|nr:hypothetical protein [Actinomycetota bacterium]